MDTALRMGSSASPQTRFWIAYSFDVRPGIAVDPGEGEFKGNMMSWDGISVFIGKSNGVNIETRNLGVFVLYEPDGKSVARVEVYNLDRTRGYSSYPVYWLGRAESEESLDLLRQTVATERARKVAQHGVVAIALHDDPKVTGILKNFAAPANEQEIRRSSIHWIGHIGGELQFLTDLVRNDREDENIREAAAFAIGMSRDTAALNTLTELYRTIPNREIRKKIIHAISMNDNQEPAIDLLIKIAKSDPDTEARKQAMFWLGHKVGEKSLGVLKDAVDDPDTEVQKQAVFVISRRPKDEAVPLLIKIARTHSKGAIRKDAIFWLGRTGDERALAFFEELLAK
jgi:HEAT repeat protein